MQTLSRTLPLTCILALAAPLAVADDEPSFYAEGFVGIASIDFESTSYEEDEVLGVRGGYNISPYFAIEGEFIGGAEDHTMSFSSLNIETGERTITDVRYGLDSIVSVFGKATLPVGDRIDLHARLGLANATRSSTSRRIFSQSDDVDFVSIDDSDSGLAYGLGASLNITDKIYARADFTRYEVFVDPQHTGTIGLGVKF